MARKGLIENNEKRRKLTTKYAKKRAELKEIIYKRDLPLEERFEAQLKLSGLPRNGAGTRYRNRCHLTGRPRGTYRKFGLSRIELRKGASEGRIPGVTKASW